MKVIYPNACRWEKDYILTDILKNQCEALYFDITQNSINSLCSEKDLTNNCIFVTTGLIRENVNIHIIERIKPKVVIYLSDETTSRPSLYDCIKANCRAFIYCYHYSLYDTNKSNLTMLQMPLGYVSGYLQHCNNLSENNQLKPIKDREYNCSFVGVIKSDRQEMFDVFSANMDKSYFSTTGDTHGFQIGKLNVSPDNLYKIYSDSVFVLNGRGYRSLDCFRIYEAIVAGAIPVIVGKKEELDMTFKYDGYSFKFVSAESWTDALVTCKQLLENKDELQSMQDYNRQWWLDKLNSMNNIICN